MIAGPQGRGVVAEVRWAAGNRISHRVMMEQGSLAAGDGVIARVDVERRRATQRNHTATHLLQAALRSLLGAHVRQSGSLVTPDRLRFDFSHYEPLSDEDVRAVEDAVNHRIMENIPVRTEMEAFEKARARGAMALFGEKYGEQVRVVAIEGASCELCGGTHARSTGEIGSFRIVSETGIAAGTRRIEAVTGQAALEVGREAFKEVERASAILRVPSRELEEGARKSAERIKGLEKEIAELRQRLAGSEVGEILKTLREVSGIKVAAARVTVPDGEILKHLADKAQEQVGDGVVCLGSKIEDRAAIVVSVGAAAVSRGVKASVIAKKLGEIVGGRGGGKDTFAQAGGKSPEMLDAAIGGCAEVIAGLVG